MFPKYRRTAVLLLLMSIGLFATDIYLPSLPAIAEAFQVDRASVQLSLFVYMLSFSFMPLFLGPLSDHIGRIRVLHFGLFFAFIMTLGCILSTSINWLILFRLLQGIGTGAIMIATRAMFSDFYKGRELATQVSYITMSMPLVLAVAPMIGGYLQEVFQWQAPFCFLLLYLAAAGYYALKMEETLESKKHISTLFIAYREILSKPAFIFFGLGIGITSFGILAYLTFSPFLFQNILGLNPAQYGITALGIGAAVMSASYLNIRLLQIFSIPTLIQAGSLSMIAAGILMYFSTTTPFVLLSAMVYFCALPFTSSNSVSKALGQIKHYLGGANALLTCIQFLSGAAGSLLFSFIPVTSAKPLAFCFMGLGLLSSLMLYFAKRYEHEH